MKSTTKKIINLVAHEVLLSIFDLSLPFFYAEKRNRRSILKYQAKRESDRIKMYDRIGYLKRQGYIKSFVTNKQKYIKLTSKGAKYLANISLKKLKISKQLQWDKKWRVVIFDVPEKFRFERDILRRKLYEFGFYKIQKSVYVYPFECTAEIKYISDRLNIKRFVLIAISELIQNEEIIINHFIKNKLLQLSDISK